MVSKHAVIAAGVLLIVAAIFSSAFDLGLSADSVSATWCSNGAVDAWVSGATPGATAYFSVQTGYSTTSINNPSATVSTSGSAGSTISVSVPQCITGSQLVTVTAQVCEQNAGGCQTQTRKLIVSAQSCAGVQCANTYNTQETKIVYPTPNPTAYCGSAPCGQGQSTIVRQANYPSTLYSAVLERVAAQRCISAHCVRDQLKAGETIALQLFAHNAAAAGTFEVRADSANPSIVATPKSTSFDMARGERTALDFTVAARDGSVPGSYAITFSLWHSGVKLDEFTQWVEVVLGGASSESAKLVLPPGIVLNGCSIPMQVSIPATLYNPGSSQQFAVKAQLQGQTAYSQPIAVAGGASSQFQITFDSTRLSQGDNWLDVSASSSEFEGSGRLNLVVIACATPAQEKLDIRNAFTSISGTRLEVVATVANTGTSQLGNVTGELVGLPSGWTQTSSTPSLAPGQVANLSIAVTSTSSEAAKPILLVKNNGKVLASRDLGTINAQSSNLTGFLVLGDATMVAIIIVLMVLAAAMLFAAANQNKTASHNMNSSRPSATAAHTNLG